MLLIAGPRQVGKTTISKSLEHTSSNIHYLNWDNLDHRQMILQGPSQIAHFASLEELSTHKPLLVLDEIHKYSDWKTLLKGLYDTYHDHLAIVVTGSSKLDIYIKEEKEIASWVVIFPIEYIH